MRTHPHTVPLTLISLCDSLEERFPRNAPELAPPPSISNVSGPLASLLATLTFFYFFFLLVVSRFGSERGGRVALLFVVR